MDALNTPLQARQQSTGRSSRWSLPLESRATNESPPPKHDHEPYRQSEDQNNRYKRVERDRKALIMKRNQAEARLRDRFLRFGASQSGSYINKNVGAGSTSASNLLLPAIDAVAASQPGSAVDGEHHGIENALNTAASIAETGPDSQCLGLAALRKRQKNIESLSSADSNPHASVRYLGSGSESAADPGAASEDRRKRIEMLRSRRRQLETRTQDLLHRGGRPHDVPHAPEASRSAASAVSAPSIATAVALSSHEPPPLALPPKRVRRERGSDCGNNNDVFGLDGSPCCNVPGDPMN